MKMRYFLIALGLLVTFANPVFAADISVANAGFIPANIWYSKDPFYAGDKVRIYTIIFNGSGYDLTGKVVFLDKGVSIGSTTFSIAKNGRVQDMWVDWKATEGKHTFTANLVDVVAVGPNGRQAIVLPNGDSGKSDRVVGIDPVAKEALAKREADKAAKMSAETLNKVDNAVQTVNDVIPVPVKEGVSSGVGVLETFRIGEAYHFGVAQNDKAKEIEVIKAEELKALAEGKPNSVHGATDTMLNTAQKPFAYVMLAIYTALRYIFEWQILFYGILLYVLYRILRWVIGKLRRRNL